MENKQEILISVIVPCYNVEKYVIKCLDSLVNQDQKGIEIIVVDDCSTDNTRQLLNDYIDSNPKIRYIKNEKNLGLAYSRNVGLKESKGKYIGFIDSDDYVSNNYYKGLYDAIIKEESEIAIADINIVYEDQNGLIKLSKASDGGTESINFIDNGLAASACNKLFKRELIIKYPFLEGKINEDIAAVIPAIVDAKKISYVPSVQYNYVQRNTSIQNSSISDKRFDIFNAVGVCLDRIKGNALYYDYKRSIIFNQIILFFIYVLPKEQSFYKRYRFLKKFEKMSRKYNIRKNTLLWHFLNNQGRYHKYYYKIILKLNCNGFHFLTNILIEMYNFWRKRIVKKVIKSNITINDLIKMAKIQRGMKDSSKSISVIVPNYNYEIYLLQRIYSILYQKVKINEIIILDDCSSDNSRELIDKIYNELKPYLNIKKEYNKENSGSAFKQWQKGFLLAKSDYIWIAEADDYCSNQFAKKIMTPLLKDNDIVLSYSDTAFIDAEGKIILKTIKTEIDIMKTGHWNKSYIIDGKQEVYNYTFLNCTIANVSSVIFKKGNYNNYFKLSGEYKQAGDWLFYANIMQNGKVAYFNKTLNYYRVHGNNVSSTTKKIEHINEIKKIHAYFKNNFKLTSFHENQIENRYAFLKRVWKLKKD